MRETISPLPHDSIVPSSLQPPLEGEPSIMAGKTSFVSAVFAAIMEGFILKRRNIKPPFPLKGKGGLGGIGLKKEAEKR